MSQRIKYIISELKDQYLIDDGNRPWIIGFSGGKDSTALLQLVWRALRELESQKLNREVFVICNDTLVENPIIVNYVDKVLSKIQQAAVEQNLPIKAQKTIPRLEDSFGVNVVGRGYPVPNNAFRWCTDKMKIKPTARFITEQVAENGEAIILIGTRSSESFQRAKSINELFQIYADASADDYECPTMVADKKHASCGQSRFGCWTCTVVKEDKSMLALINKGNEWMKPLFELRQSMVNQRNISDNRLPHRRNGQKAVTEDGHNLGTYTTKYRAQLLEEILIAQKKLQETDSEVTLINNQELVAIQVIWNRDLNFEYKVSDIYNRVYNKELEMETNDKKLQKEIELLKSVCSEDLKDYDLIYKYAC